MTEQYFKPGDLVWAKLDTYPYWPAKIASQCITDELKACMGEEGIAVLFLGIELTYSLVNKDCIKNFEECFDVYSRAKVRKTSKDDFERALEMAKVADTIEEPPLELDEEERIVKAIKIDNMNGKEQPIENVKKMKRSEEKSGGAAPGNRSETISKMQINVDTKMITVQEASNEVKNEISVDEKVATAEVAQKENKSNTQHEEHIGSEQENGRKGKIVEQASSEKENQDAKSDDVSMTEVSIDGKHVLASNEDASKSGTGLNANSN
ncbi:uncharacterized protein VICG_01892 [Vittaforma corneae ATCC 50505]|uniref:PWWP domain-containing protein n=1 Tax=Vittaforma corneae (strain ATCC 50505) TaxID=993615 RepID=L2GKG4_VITCO|nr:uncharacterized protein VICG_01892 [Vittaforma corneae ATCC 50505]ELA41099.1 hypothetical protein VICG_01892 [Vittaforma corneae ATCC 50505]